MLKKRYIHNSHPLALYVLSTPQVVVGVDNHGH